jgi:uncharacterized protein (DUF362 family)
MIFNMTKVAVVQTEPVYPEQYPYHPSESYPEYPFPVYGAEKNFVYAGVRELFVLLGYDLKNLGTFDWNPLGFLIEPGMTVVLKPNFVLDKHAYDKDIYSIITHSSVLRAIIDYVWIALKGEGKIIIADAPQYDCNFDNLIKITQIDKVIEFYNNIKMCNNKKMNIEVSLLDLRKYWSKGKHFSTLSIPLTSDPKGGTIIDIGTESLFYNKSNLEKIYGANYSRQETTSHHWNDIHQYELSNTIMSADVVISVPKLKVHKKVGVTLNAKNLVGVCTDKNYLAHYTLGSPDEGGDQYPSGLFTKTEELLIKLERWMYDNLLAPKNKWLEYIHRSIYWLHNHTTKKSGLKVDEEKRKLDAGNWYGNDTAWRMTADLVNIFDIYKKKRFSIIDGIIGGEKNGPLTPDPKKCGLLIGGNHFITTDIIATKLMGFDPNKIKLYKYFINKNNYKIEIASNEDLKNKNFYFEPHMGWKTHIEIGKGIWTKNYLS